MIRQLIRRIAQAFGYNIVAWRPPPTDHVPPLPHGITTREPPMIGNINFGDLRSLEPMSRAFGNDRGTSILRYYIDEFLRHHGAVIAGHVLEVAEDRYARNFGSEDAQIDVLFPRAGHPGTTIIGDLATGVGVPLGRFDVVILTQVLSSIYAIEPAIGVVYRALKPGGVVLATFPGIAQITRYDMDRWGEYWHLTDLAARRLFEEWFPTSSVEIDQYGNVMSAVALLSGAAAEELTATELAYRDPDYPVLIGVMARKGSRSE